MNPAPDGSDRPVTVLRHAAAQHRQVQFGRLISRCRAMRPATLGGRPDRHATPSRSRRGKPRRRPSRSSRKRRRSASSRSCANPAAGTGASSSRSRPGRRSPPRDARHRPAFPPSARATRTRGQAHERCEQGAVVGRPVPADRSTSSSRTGSSRRRCAAPCRPGNLQTCGFRSLTLDPALLEAGQVAIAVGARHISRRHAVRHPRDDGCAASRSRSTADTDRPARC